MSYEPYAPGPPRPERRAGAAGDGRRLAEAPRPVPLTFRLASTNLGLIELFLVLMAVISPLALWILVPWTRVAGPAVAAIALGARLAQLYRRRVPLLRWGEVATVGHVERRSTATSYENVPLRTAHGWRLRWQWFSGVGNRSEVSVTVGGRAGSLVVRGLPYAGGVVLADPRDPRRALCVSELTFPVEPGDDGHYRGGLPWPAWVLTVLTLGLEASFVVALVVAVLTWG